MKKETKRITKKKAAEKSDKLAPVIEEGSNGKVPPELLEGDIKNAFTHSEGYSSIKVLVEPGDIEKFRSLLMRVDFPVKRTYAHIQGIAAMRILAYCEKYGIDRGKEELMNTVAAFTSADGKRADMVVDAIIGDRRQARAEGRGFTKRLGDIAKNGFSGNRQDGDGI